ncbi:hypothetical protein C0J50_3521 [Silurus asotus]|uniref:Uncharacterized protein n=1 Tax=Silurus asotus TaxID=30991 RepID=A0AAD5AF91_SILAS|nr:hypothetical protein C0J50_3521 [Silurus asotus]
MLCWLKEEEMSVQEFQERVGCVITHVGWERKGDAPPSACGIVEDICEKHASLFHGFRKETQDISVSQQKD